MATEVPIQTGLLITPAPTNADATGNYCVVTGANGVLIECINASGAGIDVTLDDVNSTGPEGFQTFNPDPKQTVPAAGRRHFRVKDMSRFRNSTNNRISWTCTAAPNLSFNVFEL